MLFTICWWRQQVVIAAVSLTDCKHTLTYTVHAVSFMFEVLFWMWFDSKVWVTLTCNMLITCKVYIQCTVQFVVSNHAYVSALDAMQIIIVYKQWSFWLNLSEWVFVVVVVCCRCIWSCSVSHVVSLLHRTTSCSHITTLCILVLSSVASISRLCSSCWWFMSVNLLNNKHSHCSCLSLAYYTRQHSRPTGQLSISGSTLGKPPPFTTFAPGDSGV